MGSGRTGGPGHPPGQCPCDRQASRGEIMALEGGEMRGEERPYCQGPGWKPRDTSLQPGSCGACGVGLTGRRRWFCSTRRNAPDGCRARWVRNHIWGYARKYAIKMAEGRCCKCGQPAQEVNHLEPRRGRGYQNGCHHHQAGLEALCHACHLAVTSTQRSVAQRPRERGPGPASKGVAE